MITIADLRRTGKRLGLRCGHCSRFRYMRDSRFAEADNIAELAKRMRCARCGSENVNTEAVAKDPATGFWPAESS